MTPYYAPLSGAIPQHPCGEFNGMGYDPVGSRLSYYRGGDLSQPFPVSLTKPSARPPPFHSHKPHLSESARCGRLDLWEGVKSESFYRIRTAPIALRSLLALPKTQQHAKSQQYDANAYSAMFYARST